MTEEFEVGIIGGGLAGLCCALHLNKMGISCIVWEKSEFPRHKVCGEYVSNETLSYLKFLGYDPFDFGAVAINEFNLTHWNGKKIHTHLEQGAFGISRFQFDNGLYEQCISQGVVVKTPENVTSYTHLEKGYEVKTSTNQTYQVNILVSAHGKKSNMDRVMNREFFQKDADFLGIKYHFNYDIPSNLVYLNNFKGGYGGISMVENKVINVCYLTTKSALKKYGSIGEMEEAIVYPNPFLKDVFVNGEKLFSEPKVISDFNFRPKKPVEDGIIMIGDSAGLIAPLCGNGMAMAIHGAYIAATEIIKYKTTKTSKTIFEKSFAYEWHKAFHGRLKFGHTVQHLFGKKNISSIALRTLQISPFLLKLIIRKTHGKDFFANG